MPSHDPPPEARLARIAERQHGRVTLRQLEAIGIRGTSVKRRVASGRLVRVYPGVYAVGHVQQTREGRWIARTLDPADVTKKDAIPLTTAARTLVDLTDVLGTDRLLRAMREAEYLKLLNLDTLIAAVERANGRRRLNELKKAIQRHRPGQIVREELEHQFQELVHAAGLPEPETNIRVKTRRRTYKVDCLWPKEGVAVELDGRAAHIRAAAFEEDRARDAALSAIGLRPLRFTWYRVTREGKEVLAELKATLSCDS